MVRGQEGVGAEKGAKEIWDVRVSVYFKENKKMFWKKVNSVKRTKV